MGTGAVIANGEDEIARIRAGNREDGNHSSNDDNSNGSSNSRAAARHPEGHGDPAVGRRGTIRGSVAERSSA